mmetsp:Transcript_2102/g.3842  ORF Transcript_2102/g.3842 Transcript_2102/m.3842 type:complete len:141 (-) Transcript_2102:773-1195(-)
MTHEEETKWRASSVANKQVNKQVSMKKRGVVNMITVFKTRKIIHSASSSTIKHMNKRNEDLCCRLTDSDGDIAHDDYHPLWGRPYQDSASCLLHRRHNNLAPLLLLLLQLQLVCFPHFSNSGDGARESSYQHPSCLLLIP